MGSVGVVALSLYLYLVSICTDSLSDSQIALITLQWGSELLARLTLSTSTLSVEVEVALDLSFIESKARTFNNSGR